MKRKLIVLLILCLMIFVGLVPLEVRAAFVQGKDPASFQQIASAYPNGETTGTYSIPSAYPGETITPPTAAFGNATQTQTTNQTPSITPIRTVSQATGFVTATSSYANTAAAIQTMNASTVQAATKNLPLYTPGTMLTQTEALTVTSTSMPSWTPSPSFTSFPTLITTPRVLNKGENNTFVNLQLLLSGLGILALTCFLAVGIWYFRKKP